MEFNRYKALELFQSLHKMAHDLKHEKYQYYRVAYNKVNESTAYFQEVLFALLGDKEQEKVMDRGSKVD